MIGQQDCWPSIDYWHIIEDKYYTQFKTFGHEISLITVHSPFQIKIHIEFHFIYISQLLTTEFINKTWWGFSSYTFIATMVSENSHTNHWPNRIWCVNKLKGLQNFNVLYYDHFPFTMEILRRPIGNRRQNILNDRFVGTMI